MNDLQFIEYLIKYLQGFLTIGIVTDPQNMCAGKLFIKVGGETFYGTSISEIRVMVEAKIMHEGFYTLKQQYKAANGN